MSKFVWTDLLLAFLGYRWLPISLLIVLLLFYYTFVLQKKWNLVMILAQNADGNFPLQQFKSDMQKLPFVKDHSFSVHM